MVAMQWALVVLFHAIGLIAAGAGLRRVIVRTVLCRRGQRVTGTVVAIREATVDTSSVFAPVVSFPTDQGDAEITGAFACPCYYRVGQQVPICYSPENPGQGVILTRQEAVKAWGLVAGGLVLIGIGAGLVFAI